MVVEVLVSACGDAEPGFRCRCPEKEDGHLVRYALDRSAGTLEDRPPPEHTNEMVTPREPIDRGELTPTKKR